MKLEFLNDNDVAMKVFNDYSGIALTALVTNRLMFYHHEGFITDEEFFKLERTGSIESVTKYLNDVADKKLAEIREKNYESL